MAEHVTIRTLVKIGDEYAVIIDQHMLESLAITPNTPLEVRIENGGVATALNAENARRHRIDESLKKVNTQIR